ncbi:hypothetical protein MAR_013941 [Mya arenaria]|uniref:Uncharacterized protein n=1 Tax=Mya arenaria TaxID=6604 RepID=A0ABY7G1B8_MYAAR|nr:hypothetical protein MAR_013941 [Mya arenaria]
MGKAQGNRASRSVRKRKSGCKGKEKKGVQQRNANYLKELGMEVEGPRRKKSPTKGMHDHLDPGQALSLCRLTIFGAEFHVHGLVYRKRTYRHRSEVSG